jgi:hypothetical protein
MNIEELQINGSTIVIAVEECPEIAVSSQTKVLLLNSGYSGFRGKAQFVYLARPARAWTAIHLKF